MIRYNVGLKIVDQKLDIVGVCYSFCSLFLNFGAFCPSDFNFSLDILGRWQFQLEYITQLISCFKNKKIV